MGQSGALQSAAAVSLSPASAVLTATGIVNGKGQILIPYSMDTI